MSKHGVMVDVFLLLSITALLAFGTTLTGRALCLVLSLPRLQARTPESFAAAALLGTGVWVLVFGYGSYLGLKAQAATIVLCGVLVLLLGAVLWRGRIKKLLPQQPTNAILLIGACVLAVLLVFLPYFLGHAYFVFNDSVMYSSVAEWLQDHAFGTPCPADPEQPAFSHVTRHQQWGLRMGAVFLLALVQSLIPSLRALELLLPVMAWGVALNLCGIYLLCRWSLGTGRWVAGAAVIWTAIAANPLHYAATYGFLPQSYGLANLLFALALLARLGSPQHWRVINALLLALVGAVQLSVYSELTPVLAIAGLAYLLVSLRTAQWQASRRMDILVRPCWSDRNVQPTVIVLRFAVLAIFFLAILGNVELLRTLRSVRMQFGHLFGYHVPWSAHEFWAFALGLKPYFRPLDLGANLATLLATISLALGVYQLFKRRQAAVGAALLGLCVLTLYLALMVPDPWKGTTGHSFLIFKVCNWAFPLLIVVAFAGLEKLLQPIPGRVMIVGLACLVSGITAWPYHWTIAQENVRSVQAAAMSPTPFRAWRQLAQRVDQLGSTHLYLAHEPEGCWPRCLLSYLLAPRPFLNGWPNPGACLISPWLVEDQPVPAGATVTYLTWGHPPFVRPRKELSGGLCLLDPDRPTIVRLVNRNGLEQDPDGTRFTWLDSEPAQLWIWSPCAGEAELRFQAVPGPSGPTSLVRHLRVTGSDGSQRPLELEGRSEGSVRLTLPSGVSRLVIACLDSPSGSSIYKGDPRVLLVCLRAVQIRLLEETLD